MKRDIYKHLLKWKAFKRRKPLILNGARQTGKTHALQHFATLAYDDVIYINFDEHPNMAGFFEEDLNPKRIIKELAAYFKKPIHPKTTLLIFDEIQECPNALNSLKYFCEKQNTYHIASAGSLLGVKLSEGFPVGKVNFLQLHPLSFMEFLSANGEDNLRQMLTDMNNPKALSLPFHEKLIKWLKIYFIVGGMPEAVASYIENASLQEVREIQKEIINAYILDFAKHAPSDEVMKIMAVWNSIPNQLAKENKKFIFSAISKNARGREYEASIQWLVDAGLIIKSQQLVAPKLPLSAYTNPHIFKIFLLDIGLLGAMSQMDPQIMFDKTALFQEFKGALTENYVAQTLYAKYHDTLYYWSSAGTAEVDFIVAAYQHIFPLEVKAGLSRKKKSLLVYAEKYLSHKDYPTHIISRTTLRNFAHDASLVNYPLYAIHLFPELSITQKN